MLVLEYTRFELKARVPDSPATTTSDAELPEYETEATAWGSSEEEECPGQQTERGCGREECRACYAVDRASKQYNATENKDYYDVVFGVFQIHGEEGLKAGLKTELKGDKDPSNRIRHGQPVIEPRKRRVKEEPEDEPRKRTRTSEAKTSTAATPTPTRPVITLSDISDLLEEEEEISSNTAALAKQLANVTAERDGLLT